MATGSGRRFVQRSTISARSFLSRTSSFSGSSSKFAGLTPSRPPTPVSRIFTRQNPIFSFRLPVELSCATESLMPLHSVTASALLKSLLSSKVRQWGVLSEGFATPL